MPHRIIAFVLAEGPARRSDEVHSPRPQQRAPHYFQGVVPRQYVHGREGDVVLKAYPPSVLLAELSRPVDDAFSPQAFRQRADMVRECTDALSRHGADVTLSEEYAIAVVDGYEGSPEAFFNRSDRIAGFLKSEEMDLDPGEIEHTLKSQIKYGKDDLVVMDWDGAFVFEQTGEVDSIVELIQLANLQLLQYRILDRDLDKRLQRTETLIRTQPARRLLFWNREVSKAMSEVIRMRGLSIMQFDALSREIKLIGDWYSARLFDVAARKFHLENWRSGIREKLESLEDIYGIIAQNFQISRSAFFELMLQAGWLALILLELWQIWR